MNVLHLTYNFWPSKSGGAESQCRALSQALIRNGCEVTVLTARVSKDLAAVETDNGIKVVRLPVAQMYLERSGSEKAIQVDLKNKSLAPQMRFPRYLRTIAEYLLRALNILMFIRGARHFALGQKGCFDLIHVHTSTWISGVAAELGERLGIPVLSKESTWPSFPRTPPFVPWRRRWERLRLTNYFVALHKDSATDLITKGVPENNIVVIPNGVYLPDLASKRSCPELVIFVGNLTQGIHAKGIDTLVQAWSLVVRTFPEARLEIAGNGDGRGVKNLATELACENNIKMLGYVNDMADLYSRASIMVFPSRQEGMSNVVLEAQSWAIPVIASDIAGNREVILRSQTGFLLPVGDYVAFGTAIMDLLSNPEKRVAMGKAARTRIEQKFSMEAVTNMYLCFYDYMINRDS